MTSGVGFGLYEEKAGSHRDLGDILCVDTPTSQVITLATNATIPAINCCSLLILTVHLIKVLVFTNHLAPSHI